jgi:hypothetical protein
LALKEAPSPKPMTSGGTVSNKENRGRGFEFRVFKIFFQNSKLLFNHDSAILDPERDCKESA